MKPIEFELERRIQAPIDQVFVRLVDIEGHNEWMAGTGSMLKRTRRTSPGEPAVGTTFVDETSQGTMPGEITEMEAPHTVVFHWWDTSKSGRVKFEGWPSYHLQPRGDNETLVRHRGKLMSYGVWRLGSPIWRRIAVKGNAPSPSTRSRRPSSEAPALLLGDDRAAHSWPCVTRPDNDACEPDVGRHPGSQSVVRGHATVPWSDSSRRDRCATSRPYCKQRVPEDVG